jgi:L-asparaginase
MGLYETSREMISIGIVSGQDLTFEAAVTKLMFILGNYSSREEVIAKLAKPIAGEIYG